MNILCVGKNYAKHAAELGSKTPQTPIWFWKPAAAVIDSGDAIKIPEGIGDVHYEVEWAVRIGADGQPDAMTVAIDVTARDMQNKAKAAGQPWTQSKGYHTFLPLGAWQPLAAGPHAIRLAVNGEVCQDGSTADMTWGLQALLGHAATWTTLREGDILLTGTPEGVGPICPGDWVQAWLNDQLLLDCPVTSSTQA